MEELKTKILLLGEMNTGKTVLKEFVEKIDINKSLILFEMKGLDLCTSNLDGERIKKNIITRYKECNLVIVMLNRGGLQSQSEEVLNCLLDMDNKKKFVFIYNSNISRVAYLKKDIGLCYVEYNCVAYRKYTRLNLEKDNIFDYKFLPGLYVIPNSEELSTTLDKSEMLCTNETLSGAIESILIDTIYRQLKCKKALASVSETKLEGTSLFKKSDTPDEEYTGYLMLLISTQEKFISTCREQRKDVISIEDYSYYNMRCAKTGNKIKMKPISYFDCLQILETDEEYRILTSITVKYLLKNKERFNFENCINLKLGWACVLNQTVKSNYTVEKYAEMLLSDYVLEECDGKTEVFHFSGDAYNMMKNGIDVKRISTDGGSFTKGLYFFNSVQENQIRPNLLKAHYDGKYFHCVYSNDLDKSNEYFLLHSYKELEWSRVLPEKHI